MSAAAQAAGRVASALTLPEGTPPIGAREMAAIVSKHRWRIATALVLPPLLALALIVLLPPRFRAETDIVVKTGREYMAQSGGDTATLTAPTSTKQESINSEIALLTSRAVAESTIAAVGIDRLYPQIVADPPTSGTVMDAAVLQFGHDLSVEPVKLSNVVSLTFDAASQAQAREVLDTLVRVYVDKHTAVFAGRRADGYRGAIDTAMGEIRALEGRRMALKLDSGLFDVEVQRKSLIEQRTDAEGRLEEATSRRARLQARLQYLNAARAQVPATVQAASTEQSDARTHAAEALIDLHAQEAALTHRLGDSNPDLQRLRAQIATVDRVASGTHKERNATSAPSPLRQQVEQELVTTGAELATTGTEIERLTAFVAARGLVLAGLERGDLALRDLVLQIDVLTQSLRAMQGRFEQARADEQTDLARQVSVVQVAGATGSERPVSPRKLIFGAAGLLGGVLLAGLAALLTIAMSKTAMTGEAAERRVGVPVLGVVPFHGKEAGYEDRAAFGVL